MTPTTVTLAALSLACIATPWLAETLKRRRLLKHLEAEQARLEAKREWLDHLMEAEWLIRDAVRDAERAGRSPWA